MVTQNEEVQAEPQQEPAVVEPTGDVTPPVPEPAPEPVPEPQPEPVPAVAPVDQSAELARLQAHGYRHRMLNTLNKLRQRNRHGCNKNNRTSCGRCRLTVSGS